MDTGELSRGIKEKALEVGFDLVGICPATEHPESRFLSEWLDNGFAGEMRYMEREPARRASPTALARGARSVISCGVNYNTEHEYSTQAANPARGWISRYAWGDDYHEIITDRLGRLARHIGDLVPRDFDFYIAVDTAPVLDRVYAKYSGLGWFGKNTCIINQGIGSWILIGEIITNLELRYDAPPPDRCGTCTRCIDACPTNALLEPYVLDSRRCISYLTIELKGSIPKEIRERVGDNVFGCDICQDVCPWNRKAGVTDEASFRPREGLFNPQLSSLARLTPEEFRERFKGSPIKRAKRRGLLRNIMVAIGNSGDSESAGVISDALRDDEPLVRAHAAWALWKLIGASAYETLSRHLESEEDPVVVDEILEILNAGAGS